MKTIILKEECLVSVTVHNDYMKNLPEDEQLIAKLKGHRYCSTHSEDHPEFDKVRRELEEEGYLKVYRNFWNGDIVLNPFVFNGVNFKKGDHFCCAAAMSSH